MLQQAIEFKEESRALHALLKDLEPADYERQTQFKSWTVHDVLGHLHLFNVAAEMSLNDEPAFMVLLEEIMPTIGVKDGMRSYTNTWLGPLQGPALLDAWWQFVVKMSDSFASADPKRRLKWFGPDMSVRSSITARLMETWAHGQELYDLLGRERVNFDRIKNIAHLGVSTYGWAFRNRGLPIPDPAPHVRLMAPSGAIWEWNTPDPQNAVEGDAAEFCQVVTQVRNIADTSLKLSGDTAKRWMEIAQCFAGPPETPPAAGTRGR